MPSKVTNKQRKLASSLAAAAFRYATEVAGSLEIFWTALLAEGQSLPLTEEDRILAIGRWLETTSEREAAADEALDWELQGRAAMVRENEEAAKELRQKAMNVRQGFEGTFGQGMAKILLGLGPDLPEEPALLEAYIRSAVHKLERPGFTLPAPLLRSQRVEVADLIAELKPPLARQQAALRALNPEKRGAQLALKHKRAASGEHGRALLVGARYLEALFILAGEDFLAERLRESRRAAGADTGSEEQEPDGEDGEGQGEEPEETPSEDREEGPVPTGPLPAALGATLEAPAKAPR